MNNELSGGELGLRVANKLHNWNLPDKNNFVYRQFGDKVYKIDRNTGSYEALNIPIDKKDKRIIRTTESANGPIAIYEDGSVGKLDYKLPTKTVKPTKPHKSAVNWWDASGKEHRAYINDEDSARFSEGVISAGGHLGKPSTTKTETTKKRNRLTPTQSWRLQAQALDNKDPIATNAWNEDQSDNSTQIVYTKVVNWGRDISKRVALPKIPSNGGSYQLTIKDLRKVMNSRGLKSYSAALDWIMSNVPGVSNRHPITNGSK